MTRPFITAAALALSLLATAVPASAQATQAVEAGPIWNNGHAQQVCRALARERGMVWTGHWWTTVPGRMSVCELRAPMLGEVPG